MGIADVCLVAALSRLLGTDLAAATTVLHQAHARAAGGHGWAAARPVAQLLARLGLAAFRRFSPRLQKRAGGLRPAEKLTDSGML